MSANENAPSEQGNRPSIYIVVFLLLTAIFAILLCLALRESNKPDKLVQSGVGGTGDTNNTGGTGGIGGKEGTGVGGIGLVNVEEEGGVTDVTATNALTLYVAPGLIAGTPGAGIITNTPSTGKKPKPGPTGHVSFFGTESVGTRIVYLVDSSGSMRGSRFNIEKQELARSLRMLKPHMKFAVVFYDNQPHYSIFNNPLRLVPGNKQNIDKAVRWLRGKPLGGGNLVVPGFKVAVKFRPDTVFLLSDGMVDLNPKEVCADILKLNSTVRARVNTISLHEPSGTNLMKRIAHQNNGGFRYIAPK